ncbi:hypothetical protein FB451DRAFT_1338721 [Mycena latifolia]|nr:hypothetical protein FB451DRAFT_1338721 [Mycena latifolia]
MSWLNFNLVPYIAKTRILPDTQVATQQGVQTRDLMSYLAAIKCWAERHKVTVYALKQDQMKGFDYLSLQGISLGHHYLNDLMTTDPDTLIITTGSAQKADPHLPDDLLQAKVVMAEATDDSYIFARTLTSLRRSALAMERFQFAYGWLTQWLKSTAYVLEPTSDPPDYVEFDSITNVMGVNPLNVTVHKVKLMSNELDFLRAKVDDPHARFEELKNFIDDFTFPRFLRHPPITLLRKIVKQNIISKARALLSLQPIRRADAEDLDRRLKNKIHMESGMPFIPNSDVLTLPIDLHGLDFPSIARINDGIAIDGIFDHKSVTAALTGPTTLVLRIEGRNVFILHGELTGLIMGLILSDPNDDGNSLFTDHLNAVRLIDDSRTAIDQQARLRGMNGRSYYRWILRLISENPLKITYTPGHSSEVSTPAHLNFEADHYASSAQRHLSDVHTAPVPTFFMDEFTFFTNDDGWIESNIRNYVEKSQTLDANNRIAAGHQQRMALHLYDTTCPPEYSYTMAYSAYSAVVQLYARSGQLPTADVLYARDKLPSASCHIPKFDHTLPIKVGDDGERLARTRLAHHFASEWHTACIRLAGRIWSDWQRDMAKKNDTRSR